MKISVNNLHWETFFHNYDVVARVNAQVVVIGAHDKRDYSYFISLLFVR